MKKSALVLAMSLAFLIVGGMVVPSSNTVYANKKEIKFVEPYNVCELMYMDANPGKVEYTFSDGILTVSGTGIATKSYREVVNADDIEQVVINEGITAIADYAFGDLKNLKKIVIPKSVEKIGMKSLAGLTMNSIVVPATVKNFGYNAMIGGHIKKVVMPGNFNCSTYDPSLLDEEGYPLKGAIRGGDKRLYQILPKTDHLILNSDFNPNVMTYFYKAKKISLSKKDKKYKVFSNLIYTRNGKKLVMVPASTKHVKVRNGCKVILADAFLYYYGKYSASEDWNCDSYYIFCNKLKTVTIPHSVKRIKWDKNKDIDYDDLENVDFKWKLKSGKWRGNVLVDIRNICQPGDNFIFLSKKYNVKEYNNMFISYDGVLIKYCGYTKINEGKGKKRYEGSKNTLKIPKSVKEIAYHAFSYMDNPKVLKKVILPKTIKKINNYAFTGAYKLKKVKNLSKVKKVGKHAFYNTPLYGKKRV